VVVEEHGAPSPMADAHTGGVVGLGEAALPVVAIEVVAGAVASADVGRLAGDRGDEPIKIAVAIVVGKRGAHLAARQIDPGGVRAGGEAAAAIIPEDLARFLVGGDGQVLPAIAV